MINSSSVILSTTVFLLLIFFDKQLTASDNKNLFSLHSDNQYLLFSYVWNKDDQQASCTDLINFSMTCTSYHRLVDAYFLNIGQSYFNNNKNIFEHCLIAQRDFTIFFMNNQLANVFIHKMPLKVYIDEIGSLEKKVSDINAEDCTIEKSLSVINAEDCIIEKSLSVIKNVPKSILLSECTSSLAKENCEAEEIKNNIATLEQEINCATEYTEKKAADFTQMILYSNEKLIGLKKRLIIAESCINWIKNIIDHHKILKDNCLFQEALQYKNVPEHLHVCWSLYKYNFYKKKSLFEAFVIAKLLYQNSLYEKFAASLIGAVRKENNDYVIERLVEEETITNMINSFFEQNVVPLLMQLIENANIEGTINLSSLKQCFTIMVLAHCRWTHLRSPLYRLIGGYEWDYLQKKGPLFFDYQSNLFINLPPLIVTVQNSSVIIKGDLLSSIIQSDGNRKHLDEFEKFCHNFNVDISQSAIFRFIFLDHCKVDIDNVCKKKLLKDRKIIINIDNGPTVLLPHDNDYVFSANQKFLHEVATNGYGNQELICLEAPSNKIKEYKNAILGYKHIFYWIYFLNKDIAESNNNLIFQDNLRIFLKILLSLYFIQGFKNVITKQHSLYFITAYNTVRTLFYIQIIVMPGKIDKSLTVIPWYIIDILMQDSLFLYILCKKDIDVVTSLHKIVDLCIFRKSLFWMPLLHKIYYFSMMDNNKIIVAS